MARLDALIGKMLAESALELTFETGNGIVLRTAAGPTVMMKQPLTSPQIVGAIGELVPSDLRSGYPEPGVTRFPYMSPHGAVLVVIDHGPLVTRATVAPAARTSPQPPVKDVGDAYISSMSSVYEGTPLELASNADLMDLASQQVGGRFAQPPSSAPSPKAAAPLAKLKLKSVEAPRPLAETDPLRARLLAAEKEQEPPEPERSLPPERHKERERHAPHKARPSGVRKAGGARLKALLGAMLRARASDLHLSSGCPPMVRVDGDMTALEGWPAIKSEEIEAMIASVAPRKNLDQFDDTHDSDFAHETAEARFRINAFRDRRGAGAVLRQIPTSVRTAEEMGLPKAVLDLCSLHKGLVLVTGPTGSGKSTTLAALIDYVNRTREDHIITIEDPIEFVHENKSCLVNQREVGTHTGSFKHALRAALREDPDVVLVGELRDLETIAIAIETAETGHLVFGTLHTNTAASTVDRIIDQFPADRQAQIRTMLSESLKGVISQTLCKKIGGGRVPALEILLVPSAVSNLIREGKTFQIPSTMQTGKSLGMQTLNDALFDLVRRKVVDPAEALSKAVARTELKAMFDRAGIRVDLAAVE